METGQTSSLDGEFAHGEGAQPSQLLGGLQALLVLGQRLPDGSGLLGPEVEGLVLLALVQEAQVLLLLLGHHDVHPAKQGNISTIFKQKFVLRLGENRKFQMEHSAKMTKLHKELRTKRESIR